MVGLIEVKAISAHLGLELGIGLSLAIAITAIITDIMTTAALRFVTFCPQTKLTFVLNVQHGIFEHSLLADGIRIPSSYFFCGKFLQILSHFHHYRNFIIYLLL